MVPKYFSLNFDTFEINNLATSICVKDWDKVAPGGVRVGKPQAGKGQGKINYQGKVSSNYKD